MTATHKPLLFLVQAERRIQAIEPRDFRAEPWMVGEGVKFFTPSRVSEMAVANDKLRADRQARQGRR